METSPCPELSHPCLLHAAAGCCQPSQHLCCAVRWHRPITVLPTALAYKEGRVCHLSTPIVGRVSSTVSQRRSPLFSSPWLIDNSSPHHCFFLVIGSGGSPHRGATPQSISAGHPSPKRYRTDTTLLPRPNLIEQVVEVFSSSSTCCGTPLTLPSPCRTAFRSFPDHQPPSYRRDTLADGERRSLSPPSLSGSS
jgi:hypothetical protein